MNTPRFTAEASLYETSERYKLTFMRAVAAGSSAVVPQQDFVPPIPTIPTPGLRCFPCTGGWQVCCPPPGLGLRCFIRRCGFVPL